MGTSIDASAREPSLSGTLGDVVGPWAQALGSVGGLRALGWRGGACTPGGAGPPASSSDLDDGLDARDGCLSLTVNPSHHETMRLNPSVLLSTGESSIELSGGH